jgi:hypothetical protein
VFPFLLKLTWSALATCRQKQQKPQNHRFCGLLRPWSSVTKTDQALTVYTSFPFLAISFFVASN